MEEKSDQDAAVDKSKKKRNKHIIDGFYCRYRARRREIQDRSMFVIQLILIVCLCARHTREKLVVNCEANRIP